MSTFLFNDLYKVAKLSDRINAFVRPSQNPHEDFFHLAFVFFLSSMKTGSFFLLPGFYLPVPVPVPYTYRTGGGINHQISSSILIPTRSLRVYYIKYEARYLKKKKFLLFCFVVVRC